MARKSRNPLNAHQTVLCTSAKYLVGGYIRLSVEDSGTGKEDTIENQKAAILSYISRQSDMQLIDVYCDNGETGTDFHRPDFERMMDDVKKGKINCIVVKDLSRFGRNYLEAGILLEQDFPRRGVRFVAIQESIDTLNKQGAVENCIIPLKNILNDYYAKDISMKSGSALRVKQRQGEFIGSFAAYGYLKNPDNKHKLIIDDETAPVVKQIFDWILQGKGLNWIVGELTRRTIPSPSAYRYKKGIHKAERMKDVPWRPNAIKFILSNEVYLGHTVQGRKCCLLYMGQPQKNYHIKIGPSYVIRINL